jgi:predicted transcriptional regulator
MSENENKTADKAVSTNFNVRAQVAQTLADVGKEQVRAAVVAKLVQDEVQSRTELVLKNLNDLSRLRNDLKKIKPDQQSFDAQGKIVSETYSKSKLDELNKTNEQIAKLEKGLELALEKDDYSKLKGNG